MVLGLECSARNVTHLLRNPRSLARALISMQVIMLLLAVAAASTFDLYPAVKMGAVPDLLTENKAIPVGCSPNCERSRRSPPYIDA